MSETVSAAGTGAPLPYNSACELEDFAHPELVAVLRDIYADEVERSATFPAGAERRKHWEVAMSVRALRDFGALRPDAELLGVGAGSETTVFYLTRHARRVVATDLYLAPGVWEREAHPLMMVAPERLSPIPFELERLEVLHMDGRRLRFPDNSFDGIFSSGSIEHFGDFEDIAASAYEMGRVLKPGGVLTLSTELLLEGPPGSIGWPGVVLFSAASLRRSIIEASGLEPVDEPDLTVSLPTRATARPLVEMIAELERGRESFPHLILQHDGQLFGSVHLTLRKVERYPVTENAWARPSEELRERVRRTEGEAEARVLAAPAPAPAAPAPAVAPPPADPGHPPAEEEAFRRLELVRRRSSLEAPEPGGFARRAAGFVRRTLTRVRDLGISGKLLSDLLRTLIDRQAAQERRIASLEAAVAQLQIADGEVRGAINEIRNPSATIGQSGDGELVNLRDRVEILRVRQARMEGELADLQEEVAGRRGGLEGRK
jgi:SAM-dependent methyltransferase